MNRKTLAAKAIVPLVLLAVGFGVFRFLVVTKAEAPRAAPPPAGALVEVHAVAAEDRDVALVAHGRVVPTRQARLSSQSGGRVVWQSPELRAGGRFHRGEAMLRVDARDYRLALEARRADVERASVDVDLERSRRDVARREWESFGGGEASDEAGLTLREPQQRAASVALAAAQSGLRRAQLDLSRTTIRAPFDLLIVDEQVDLGQLVGPSAPLMTVVASDSFRVEVSVPLESLGRIALPRGDEVGAEATVTMAAGDARIERVGHVIELLPDLGTTGSLARILVQIDEPLGREGHDGELPLLLGSYVTVRIDAGRLEAMIPLPREQLHEGNHVYVMGDDGRLEIREVTLAWRDEDEVLIRAGLSAGDRVITSRLATPVAGTQLRLAEGPSLAGASPRE